MMLTRNWIKIGYPPDEGTRCYSALVMSIEYRVSELIEINVGHKIGFFFYTLLCSGLDVAISLIGLGDPD